MARIRTIKPDFFRHELLQELEERHAGLYPMLVFAGLFGHCDKEGRFRWRPKHLKLDILPFLSFDMGESLHVLEAAQMIVRYEVEGYAYGWIPTFKLHQVIGGKESQAPEKYPAPSGEVTGKYLRSDREATETAGIRKGRELGKEGKGTAANGGQRGASESPGCEKSKAFERSSTFKTVTDVARELGIERASGEAEGAFQARVLAAKTKQKAA